MEKDEGRIPRDEAEAAAWKALDEAVAPAWKVYHETMDNWTCSRCGRSKGDMELLGNGLVCCPGCGAKHYVTPSNKLSFTGRYKEVKKEDINGKNTG